MPDANKPDFSGQQKIIFQAAEAGIAKAASTVPTAGVIDAWCVPMNVSAGVCRGCVAEIELPWR
jgi:hypothetical protein